MTYAERRERRLGRHAVLRTEDWGWHNREWMQSNAYHRRIYLREWRAKNGAQPRTGPRTRFVSYDASSWARDLADEMNPLELLMAKEECASGFF